MKKVLPPNAILIPDNATRVFAGQIFDVYQWPQKMFDGSTATFEMLKRPDTVTVIGVAQGKILVIDDEQPHKGLKKSFPGGRVDEQDASIPVAAQREILEETGYKFSNWKLLSVIQPMSKLEWFIHIFLATDGAQISEPHLDTGEKINLALRSFEEVKTMSLAAEGYLGESRHLFEQVNSLNDLLTLPKFSGREVDR